MERNAITHSAAISAYEKGGEWARALQLLGVMVQGRAERNGSRVVKGGGRRRG